jgi:hypothetical protein
MKLRSHEILGTPKTSTCHTINPSRFKQLFQRKNLFKKKPSAATTTSSATPSVGLIHQIPDYVRKSLFRFLLDVKSPSPPPCSRSTRLPPVMGVQALKNKKQHCHQHPLKRSLRIKYVLNELFLSEIPHGIFLI